MNPTCMTLFRLLALTTMSLLAAIAQIRQDRPDLCGSAGADVPLPPNISAVSFDGGSELKVQLDAKTVTIPIPAAERVEQVCAIGQGRWLVFSVLAGGNGYAADIINSATGSVVDAFWARSPAVSPDGRWMVMREVTPAQAEGITEQYRLYDLTKDAAGNRFPGVDYRYVQPLGRTVYPLTRDRLPFESGGVQPDQIHSFVGDSFYWSADSGSLLFLDRTSAGLAVVLVAVSPQTFATYVHRLPSEVCVGPIARVGFSGEPSRPDVRLDFGSICPPIFIRGAAFKVAPVETHKTPIRRPSTPDKQRD